MLSSPLSCIHTANTCGQDDDEDDDYDCKDSKVCLHVCFVGSARENTHIQIHAQVLGGKNESISNAQALSLSYSLTLSWSQFKRCASCERSLKARSMLV